MRNLEHTLNIAHTRYNISHLWLNERLNEFSHDESFARRAISSSVNSRKPRDREAKTPDPFDWPFRRRFPDRRPGSVARRTALSSARTAIGRRRGSTTSSSTCSGFSCPLCPRSACSPAGNDSTAVPRSADGSPGSICDSRWDTPRYRPRSSADRRSCTSRVYRALAPGGSSSRRRACSRTRPPASSSLPAASASASAARYACAFCTFDFDRSIGCPSGDAAATAAASSSRGSRNSVAPRPDAPPSEDGSRVVARRSAVGCSHARTRSARG